MSNIISKHRPRTFKTFVGNSSEVSSVKSDLESDDITQTWLLIGEPGSGKTSLGYLMARKLLKIPVGEPLNSHPDFEEINANEDGSKERITQLIQNTRFMPKKADYRVILVDEVHRLSSQAASAFLKATEEPPKHVVYIFITSEPDKLLKTIHQRAKTIALGSLNQEELESVLIRVAQREEWEWVTKKLVAYIASRFVGRTRLAITTLKNLAIVAGKKSKIGIKELEQAVEKAVLTDYALGGGILQNLYQSNPKEACQITGDVKDLHHVINTMLDLNNALLEMTCGVTTYQNEVRKKLWRVLKKEGGISIKHILLVQSNLFKLKESVTSKPMLDPKQVLLYHIASCASELRELSK